MREIFLKIFGEHPSNEVTKISMFSWHHIIYLVLIIGAIVALSLIYFSKSNARKTNVNNSYNNISYLSW